MHIPVLKEKVLEYLNIEKGKLFFDGTLGFGGHTEAILNSNNKAFVYATDKDGYAMERTTKRLENYKDRFKFFNIDFKEIFKLSLPINQFDGFLFDLGVSSDQLDNPEMGFAYSKDSPLDMRMDKRQSITAESVINDYSYAELIRVFRDYGEFKRPEKLVKEVLVARKQKRLTTTFELKKVVRNLYRRRKTMDPLARVFQAVRIEVNKELENLEAFFMKLIELMKKGARIVIISFHSLEDRIAKNLLRKAKKENKLLILTKKPIIASENESRDNPRARSAKLRAGERI
jgi:16S rRNA (cytosine1402-N4)-methyltransferase